MKIKEVCTQTGLTDKAVRHYIRNGLVFPVYNENYTGRKNYTFSEEDVKRLKQIAILRKYEFSISSIKAILNGESDITAHLLSHIEEMKSKTDNDIQLINELIQTVNAKPDTVDRLCTQLNNANYVPKEIPVADNQMPYQLLYKRAEKEKKIICAFLILVLFIIAIGICTYFVKNWVEEETITDTRRYSEILGENGTYKSNLIGVNNIFPNEIPESALIEDFRYEYYNPFDPNYCGVLVYICNKEDYKTEYARLKSLKSSENYNTYGITGFPYELCAVMTDDYSGIIYALTDKESRKFIYVDIEFCNYFTDIDYKKVIDEKYLPYGFDAEEDNERRKEFDRKFEKRNSSELLD